MAGDLPEAQECFENSHDSTTCLQLINHLTSGGEQDAVVEGAFGFVENAMQDGFGARR